MASEIQEKNIKSMKSQEVRHLAMKNAVRKHEEAIRTLLSCKVTTVDILSGLNRDEGTDFQEDEFRSFLDEWNTLESFLQKKVESGSVLIWIAFIVVVPSYWTGMEYFHPLLGWKGIDLFRISGIAVLFWLTVKLIPLSRDATKRSVAARFWGMP